MQRRRVFPSVDAFPTSVRPYVQDAEVYDSSCSAQATVWYLDKEDGYYLKRSPKGALEREAAMTTYFHGLGLGAEVLAYSSEEEDWLLTRRMAGEDATHALYLADPARLAELLGRRLRALHALSGDGCPVPHRTEEYLDTVYRHHHDGLYDLSLFPAGQGFATAEEAWRIVEEGGCLLQTDTLIHGDYCLPNIMVDNWRLAGFVDVGNGGIADRHIDLFWGAWTLVYNLKTDRYCNRFLDAYGRDAVDNERLRVVAACEIFG